MRRLSSAAIVTISLVTLAALIGGCGASSNAAQLPAKGPITKAAATEYAHAVNLGVADVPGMVSVSLEGEGKEGPGAPTRIGCGLERRGRSAAHLVDIHSPTFRSGEGLQLQELHSEVEVARTAPPAGRGPAEMKAYFRNPRTRGCLERYFARAFGYGLSHGSRGRIPFRVGRTTVSILSEPVPRSFAFHVAIPFTLAVPGTPVHSLTSVDFFGFAVGRATISLFTFGASEPVPKSTERRLLPLLYSRAKAHEL